MTWACPITIPAAVVLHVQRDALYLLARAGDEIGQLGERRMVDPEAFVEPFGRLDRSRALLDAIGWPAPGSDGSSAMSTARRCSMVCARA